MRSNHIFIFLFFISLGINAQSFDNGTIPTTVKAADGKSTINISSKYFKDGTNSLLWKWTKENAVLSFNGEDIAESGAHFHNRAGITFWVCNETPQNSPLTFNFKDASNNTQYTFQFHLNFTGWRAGWIAYSDMWTPTGGKPSKQEIKTLEVVSPNGINNGEIWIDRVEITKKVDRQATPDAQIPENNRFLDREIWHWGLLHKWEQQRYDLPIPSSLTAKETADLDKVYHNIKNQLRGGKLTPSDEKKLRELQSILNISDDGCKGAPLMQKDNMKPGDAKYDQLSNLLSLTARGWYIHKNPKYKTEFIKAVRYMLHQGYAYESGMGTNHHYGYQIRDMYGAIWWMEDVLKSVGLWNDAREAITYWSGLQETRVPYKRTRDEITDSWNTLILPRLASAMMFDTQEERFRAMQALARWVNGSLSFTPGTLGGIKIDGTAFHHGGHYPGYSMPGYSYIGQYLKMVNGTQFGLNNEAREVFKFALLSLSRQTNLRDWGLTASGRHPFQGSTGKSGVQAYAYAAQAFDPIDRELAGEYLRQMEGMRCYSEDNGLKALFAKEGITKNDYPQGFYVYNYASQGIYRYGKNMVSLKGFTSYVWGAEIYSKDNRFGRYQSYGAVQIIGTRDNDTKNKNSVVTESASRYVQDGWDWNRNPGVTSIHLPLEKLNSPFVNLMLRQTEQFSGASRLENGKYGMFATKLGEKNYKNFTPSFKAHKSVFCFDNKIICLGTHISNDNTEYPTETILFQQALLSKDESVEINNKPITQFPYSTSIIASEGHATILKDLTGNHYYIPKGQQIEISKQHQKSVHNKLKGETSGDFAVAYLPHGKAPNGAEYEYMILLDASRKQLIELKKEHPGYTVLLKNESAHIVKDQASGARGYAIFDDFTSSMDDYILKSTEETMIMLRPEGERLEMSVCDPDLNFGEHSYTTPNLSAEKRKSVILRGEYELKGKNNAIRWIHQNGNTHIEVKCRDGIPVEFSLVKK